VWIGAEVVVRLTVDERHRGAYDHEAAVVRLLEGSGVPHARRLAHGEGPDGPWYASERLAGRSLHEVWPTADPSTRRSLVESLGSALEALHRVPAPPGLRPPWLARALEGGSWPAFHPPLVQETVRRVEAARRRPDGDAELLRDVAAWVQDRLPSFSADPPVLVHGDVHGSNVVVDRGRVTGLVDFAEAVAQPADVELDTLLRWCARPQEFPPDPTARGLAASQLAEVPRWLSAAYPALFDRGDLRERLEFHDMSVELALYAHHPQAEVRATSRDRIARLLSGRNHLDDLSW
jgi:aminoglycoside phosphotransferase (APT) family kinase protein